jgi:chemotaxis protein CheD
MRTRPNDVHLQPGAYFVGGPNPRVHTLLGSCVSVTLWHPPTRLGAMSHFLLWSRTGASPGAPADGRYGDEAMLLMVEALAARGVAAGECEAKILGGGDMFPRKGGAHPGGPTVGQRNGDGARRRLGALGIGVVSESLFGVGHRRVVFDLRNGDVWVRHAALAQSAALAGARP